MLLLLILTALADLKTDRIPNGFLIIGTLTGLAGSQTWGPGFSQSVISMILAFLLLYPLFKIGTLGAGDIKTLIMTGSFFTVKEFMAVLAAAFVTGAALSVMKLAKEHNGRERMLYLLHYAAEVIKSRHWQQYEADLDKDKDTYRRNKIHFTIPILFGAALRMGGLI